MIYFDDVIGTHLNDVIRTQFNDVTGTHFDDVNGAQTAKNYSGMWTKGQKRGVGIMFWRNGDRYYNNVKISGNLDVNRHFNLWESIIDWFYFSFQIVLCLIFYV
jgi:hypothetical protein